jgi:hypothetical protein
MKTQQSNSFFEELIGIAPLIHLIVDYCYDVQTHTKERTMLYFTKLAVLNRQCNYMIFGGNPNMWSNDPPIYFSLPSNHESLFSEWIQSCRFHYLHLKLHSPKSFSLLKWDKYTKLNLRMLRLEYEIDAKWNHSVNLLELIINIIQSFERLNYLSIHIEQAAPLSSTRYTKKHKFDVDQYTGQFNRDLSLKTFRLSLVNHEWLKDPVKLRVPQFLTFLVNISPRLEAIQLVPFEQYRVMEHNELLDAIESLQLRSLVLYNAYEYEPLQKLIDYQSETLEHFGLINNSNWNSKETIDYSECTNLTSLALHSSRVNSSQLPRSISKVKLLSSYVDFDDASVSQWTVLDIRECFVLSTIPWNNFLNLRHIILVNSISVTRAELRMVARICPLESVELDTVSIRHSAVFDGVLERSVFIPLRSVTLRNDKFKGEKGLTLSDKFAPKVADTNIKRINLFSIILEDRQLSYFTSSGMFAKLSECQILDCSCSIVTTLAILSEYCPYLIDLKLRANNLISKSLPTKRTTILTRLEVCDIEHTTETTNDNFEHQVLIAVATFSASLNGEHRISIPSGNDAIVEHELLEIVDPWRRFVTVFQSVINKLQHNKLLHDPTETIPQVIEAVDTPTRSDCKYQVLTTLYDQYFHKKVNSV